MGAKKGLTWFFKNQVDLISGRKKSSPTNLPRLCHAGLGGPRRASCIRVAAVRDGHRSNTIHYSKNERFGQKYVATDMPKDLFLERVMYQAELNNTLLGFVAGSRGTQNVSDQSSWCANQLSLIHYTRVPVLLRPKTCLLQVFLPKYNESFCV